MTTRTEVNPTAASSGKVYLVGAGPGDPGLLTLRALRVLQTADKVLHDALVPPEILTLAPPQAHILNVGKRCGEKGMSQQEIHARMIESAHAGLCVVRLQGGDPLLFGRAGEEIAALDEAGVDWEIVPGVTAASAAAAAAKFPLTDRRASSQLILLTGHRTDGSSLQLPAPPEGGGTVALYMPSEAYAEIARCFCSAGWAGTTPCVVVSRASTPDQQILRATLMSLGDEERLPTPAVLIVGEVTRVTARATSPRHFLIECRDSKSVRNFANEANSHSTLAAGRARHFGRTRPFSGQLCGFVVYSAADHY